MLEFPFDLTREPSDREHSPRGIERTAGRARDVFKYRVGQSLVLNDSVFIRSSLRVEQHHCYPKIVDSIEGNCCRKKQGFVFDLPPRNRVFFVLRLYRNATKVKLSCVGQDTVYRKARISSKPFVKSVRSTL